MSLVQDAADLRRGPAYLGGVPRLGVVLPAAEIGRHVRLALNVDVNGPLRDEPLEWRQVGALTGLVGRLVQLTGESGQRCGRDLTDGLSQGGNGGGRLGMSGCPAAEVVMAAPMGAILIPRTSLTGTSAGSPLEGVRQKRFGACLPAPARGGGRPTVRIRARQLEETAGFVIGLTFAGFDPGSAVPRTPH